MKFLTGLIKENK